MSEKVRESQCVQYENEAKFQEKGRRSDSIERNQKESVVAHVVRESDG